MIDKQPKTNRNKLNYYMAYFIYLDIELIQINQNSFD